MNQKALLPELPRRVAEAVSFYWATRKAQQRKQTQDGGSDRGLRSAVTGGAQMDGFVDLFCELVVAAGISEGCVFRRKAVELPGFFRPTKEWDLLVVKQGTLICAIEAKSQVGPSFGNDFNNRTEEAMGSALDLWTAFREKAFVTNRAPFLGYFFMLEDCAASNSPVKVQEPHFKVFPEFVGASYKRRYELFCSKLVLERHYSAAALITSEASTGLQGAFKTPVDDLSVEGFAKALVDHAATFS